MSRFLSKSSLLTVLVCGICLYILSFYMHLHVSSFPSLKLLIFTRGFSQTPGNNTKTILFWNTLFGNEHFYFGETNVFDGCPVNDCLATDDRYFMNVNEFDALLFHGNEINLDDVPRSRNPEQWYVYVNLESPESRPMPEYVYDSYFNLTMTYRLDSDFVWPYGEVVNIASEETVAPKVNCSWDTSYLDHQEAEVEEKELTNAIGRKSKPIGWFVSNCYAKSGRESYVEELAKHIDVDIYGSCGRLSCDKSRDCLRDVVEPHYFFYLSFENSLCRDYATEKLYQPLRYNVVPVVYGGANYSIFAPPHSYINTLDFNSPKDLAVYLKTLMESPREYRKYFAWKKQYRVQTNNRAVRCALCKFLHANHAPKVYDHLRSYYNGDSCPLQGLIREKGYATGVVLKDSKYKHVIDSN